jgi:hypothetical protein
MVEEDLNKGLEEYMYLIYEMYDYYILFLHLEENRIGIHHYLSSFLYLIFYINE